MTTATDFESQLDDNPSDWTLRSIYADWLEEQGDAFCETQRWLVAKRHCPLVDGNGVWVFFNASEVVDVRGEVEFNDLDALIVECLCSGTPTKHRNSTMWRDYQTRHAAEIDLHNALVKAGEITCALIEEVEA